MAYHGLIEIIQGTQNIAENYTTVTANCYCVRDSGYAYSGYKTTVNCTLDGTTESKTLAGFDISASNPKILLGSFTKKVYHNADGTKTVSADFTWNSENSYVGTITGSASKILTTIPRASSVTATDANIGSASAININRASSNLTHTLTYSFSGLSGTIATKTSSTSVGWTVPTSFYQKIPNSSSGTVTITCDTYSGETKIGTKTTTMTISVTESSKPVIDTATVIDTNATTVALTGSNKRLVSYKSTVKLDVSGRCLNYAGFSKLRENNINDISATKTTSGGTTTVTGTKTYTNNTLTQFKICLVDTRNKVSNYKILNQANSSFVVVPYIPLTINAEFKRTTPTGGGIRLKFAGNFYNGYFDANKTKFNTLVLKHRHRENGGTWSDWTNLVLNTDYSYGSGNTYSSTTISVGTDYDYKKKYEFQLSYADKLSSTTFTQTVKEGEPIFDFGKDKNGNNYLNINGEIYKYGQQYMKQLSIYVNPNNQGILVSLPDANLFKMMTFDIIGNGYATSMPLSTHIQGYHFQSLGYFIHCKQQNTSGTLPQCKFMIKDNKIALWIPPPGLYTTLLIKGYVGNTPLNLNYKFYDSEPNGDAKVTCTMGRTLDDLFTGSEAIGSYVSETIYSTVIKNLKIGGIYEVAISYNHNSQGSPDYRSVIYGILSLPTGYDGSNVVVRPKFDVIANYYGNGTIADNNVAVVCEGGTATIKPATFKTNPQVHIYQSNSDFRTTTNVSVRRIV